MNKFSKKTVFSIKNAENEDLDQRLGCAAPKRWLKYTTGSCSLRDDSKPYFKIVLSQIEMSGQVWPEFYDALFSMKMKLSQTANHKGEPHLKRHIQSHLFHNVVKKQRPDSDSSEAEAEPRLSKAKIYIKLSCCRCVDRVPYFSQLTRNTFQSPNAEHGNFHHYQTSPNQSQSLPF